MKSWLSLLAAGCMLTVVGTAAGSGKGAGSGNPAPPEPAALDRNDSQDADYATDERGRTFRVKFDPGTELRIGMMAGISYQNSTKSFDPALITGLGWRSKASGIKHEEVRWQLDHRGFWGRIRPWHPAHHGLPTLDLTLYSGTYLRHTESPFLMLPSTPPKRVFFPFDVGVDVEAGRARVDERNDGSERLRVNVARAAVLLDPVRSGRPGNMFAIGVGSRYDIDVSGTPGLSTEKLTHRIAPFTETELIWRYQDEPGLTAWELRGSWFPHWATQDGWQIDSMEASASFDRVLVAINDMPLSATTDLSYSRYPEANADERIEGRALAGLRLGFQLR